MRSLLDRRFEPPGSGAPFSRSGDARMLPQDDHETAEGGRRRDSEVPGYPVCRVLYRLRSIDIRHSILDRLHQEVPEDLKRSG